MLIIISSYSLLQIGLLLSLPSRCLWVSWVVTRSPPGPLCWGWRWSEASCPLMTSLSWPRSSCPGGLTSGDGAENLFSASATSDWKYTRILVLGHSPANGLAKTHYFKYRPLLLSYSGAATTLVTPVRTQFSECNIVSPSLTACNSWSDSGVHWAAVMTSFLTIIWQAPSQPPYRLSFAVSSHSSVLIGCKSLSSLAWHPLNPQSFYEFPPTDSKSWRMTPITWRHECHITRYQLPVTAHYNITYLTSF